MKKKMREDPGAKIADAFFGSIWFTLSPLIMFSIVHFNVIMYVRRRNRKVRERDAAFALEEGMRGPRFGEKVRGSDYP